MLPPVEGRRVLDAGFDVTGLRQPTVEAGHPECFEERTRRFPVVRALER